MNRKNIKLYNMIFPIWLLWLMPSTWIAVLPANLIIDLLVIVLTLKYLKTPDIRQHVKTVILRVWIMGFAADFIGTMAMSLSSLLDFSNETAFGEWWYSNFTYAVSYDPLDNIFSFLWTTICVVITAFFIYLFNYRWCLRKSGLCTEHKRKLALSLAVFTAPYLFYLPTRWFI